MTKTVLILDGHLRSALVAVRSLGAQGYTVVCGSHRRTGAALYSRYTSRTLRYPSPIASLTGFLGAVRDVARACPEPPLIYAFSDATLSALSRSRESFASIAVLILPSEESVEISLDKRRTVMLAKELGIAVPTTHDAIPQDPHFPAVIKPRHNVVWRGDQGIVSRVQIVLHSGALKLHWQKLAKTGEIPFIQEYIPAVEYGYSVLCEHGRIVARCVHRRIRSLSPEGGASVVRVTVEPTLGMAEAAQALMHALAWHGPAMIEFRVGRDRVAYLVEINGRFWGSLALALHAGVDMPLLCAQLVQGHPAPVPDFKRGIFSRYLLGDAVHLLRAHSWQAVKEFFSYGGRDHFSDMGSWRDPLPMVMDVFDKLF